VVSGTSSAGARLLECGVIRTESSMDLASRLRIIFEGITAVIREHNPQCLSIESAFYARNVRTTLVLGHARGVILLAARLNDLDVFEYPPAEIKKAIAGTGSATKHQVQFMVARLLRLRNPPQPSDAADGVATALAHLSSVPLLRLLGPSGTDSTSARLTKGSTR
jgi:crossover junction endodeoxyribonuclease RuvC